MSLLPDTLPGEKFLIRLWETAEKSAIGFTRPWLIRREGRARAAVEYQNKMVLGQAEADLEQVRCGHMQYDLVAGRMAPAFAALPTRPIPPGLSPSTGEVDARLLPAIPRLRGALDYVGHSMHRATARHMRREINLERILQQAEELTEQVADETVPNKEVESDWLDRWRENARHVSDGDVQRPWAHVLTGEIKNPGRYSLRTLEFLKSVSRADAELIERLGPFSLERFIYRDEAVLAEHQLSFAVLHNFQSMGIVAGVESIGFAWTSNEKAQLQNTGFICHDLGIVVPNNDKPIELPCYTITKLGQEVLSLGKFKANERYLRSLVDFLVGKGFTCELGKTGVTPEGRRALIPPWETIKPPDKAGQ